jgi:hypothetical protein
MRWVAASASRKRGSNSCSNSRLAPEAAHAIAGAIRLAPTKPADHSPAAALA